MSPSSGKQSSKGPIQTSLKDHFRVVKVDPHRFISSKSFSPAGVAAGQGASKPEISPAQLQHDPHPSITQQRPSASRGRSSQAFSHRSTAISAGAATFSPGRFEPSLTAGTASVMQSSMFLASPDSKYRRGPFNNSTSVAAPTVSDASFGCPDSPSICQMEPPAKRFCQDQVQRADSAFADASFLQHARPSVSFTCDQAAFNHGGSAMALQQAGAGHATSFFSMADDDYLDDAASCKPSADAHQLQPCPSGSSPAFFAAPSSLFLPQHPMIRDDSPLASSKGKGVLLNTALPDAKQASVESPSLGFRQFTAAAVQDDQTNTQHSPFGAARGVGVTVSSYQYCYEHLEDLSPVSMGQKGLNAVAAAFKQFSNALYAEGQPTEPLMQKLQLLCLCK